jgi:cobalamin biosynthesis protein CobT
MARKATIDNALPIVAAHYGEKFGVKVVVSGTDASTDGSTIIVPNVPEDYPNKDVVWGYLAHEAAHVRQTDFDVWNSVLPKQELRRTVLNIFEDARIEKALMEQYPGVRSDLESTVTFLKDDGSFRKVNSSDEPGRILQAKLLFWLRANFLQQPLDDLSEAAGQAMQSVFPKGVNTRLGVLLRKACSTSSTSECLDLADQVIQMLEEEAENEEPDNGDSGDGQDKGDDQDQQNNPSPSGGGDGSGNDDQPDDQPGQKDAGSNGKADDDNQSPANGSSSTTDQPQPTGSQVIRKALNSGGDDLQPDAFESLKQKLSKDAQKDGDDSYCTVPTAPSCAGDTNSGRELLKKVQATTSKLRAQLLSIVQASRRNNTRTKRSGRKLDGKRLTRIVTGDTRIFKERSDRKQANTAVHLLADLSSSMNGYQASVAREASLAIALALEGIPGVNPAVTYFCGHGDDPVRSALRHGESARRQAHRFIESSRGYTPMAEAIWHGAFELTKTRETRRILIVITDGDPDNDVACRKVLELCENSAIETIGIGICHSRVALLFDNHIVINSVEDLGKTLFQLMRDTLVDQAA